MTNDQLNTVKRYMTVELFNRKVNALLMQEDSYTPDMAIEQVLQELCK